jgi:hypothetical protein
MERYCSTGQSPQRAVAPVEEEEVHLVGFDYKNTQRTITFLLLPT